MRLGPVGVGCTSGRDSRTTVRKTSSNGVEYRDLGDVKKRGKTNGKKEGKGSLYTRLAATQPSRSFVPARTQRFLRPEGNVRQTFKLDRRLAGMVQRAKAPGKREPPLSFWWESWQLSPRHVTPAPSLSSRGSAL